MRRAVSVLVRAACVAGVVAMPHVRSASSAEYDVRVQGRSRSGSIPPKPPVGEKDTVIVVGEGTGETEFVTADEISNAVASAMDRGPNGEVALRVLAVPGKGGIQNVRDVLSGRNMDFGIAPFPVLEAAAASDGMGNLRQRLAYVAPLHNEEVHLLAESRYRDFEDLRGKEVAVGEEGSSTAIVARRVLDALGLDVKVSNLSGQVAANAVRDGKLAAVFVVSGKPTQTVSALWGRSVQLLPLPMDRIPDGFMPASLDHSDYPEILPFGMRIRTWAVQSVLFGYGWPERSPRGRVGQTFVNVLMYRLSDLQVGGRHGKWREVNVAGFVPGWKRLPAMQSWLDRSVPRVDGPGTRAEFDGFLRRTDTRVEGADRNALYKDFLRWRTGSVAALQ